MAEPGTNTRGKRALGERYQRRLSVSSGACAGKGLRIETDPERGRARSQRIGSLTGRASKRGLSSPAATHQPREAAAGWAAPCGALSLPAQVVWCAVIGRRRTLGGEAHLVARSGLRFPALTGAQHAALADSLQHLAVLPSILDSQQRLA
jgi:hypothetical protein